MINLKFHLTREEFFSFNYYTTWAAPFRKKYRMMYYTRVLLLYSVVASVYVLSWHRGQWFIDFLIFTVVGLVYVTLVPFFVQRSIRSRVAAMLKEKENQHILDQSEVIISEDGIVDRDTVSETQYNWDAIVRSSETDFFFYLYTNSYHAIVVPKRVLSDQQHKTLRGLLERHLPLSSALN